MVSGVETEREVGRRGASYYFVEFSVHEISLLHTCFKLSTYIINKDVNVFMALKMKSLVHVLVSRPLQQQI